LGGRRFAPDSIPIGQGRQDGPKLAPDKETAIAKAMEEFRIEPARRFRLIVVPVE
jgi:hypothetical protein